jgi:hypoxanthine phosphoribosyltransferase
MTTEKRYLDYIDITMMCDSIANQCKDNVDMVVGISGGGLIPAVHLSNLLNVPMECLNWSTADDNLREHNIRVADAIEEGQKILFVNDINDSGHTLDGIMVHYDGLNDGHRCQYATLVSKNSSRFIVDYAAEHIHSDKESQVTVFPWESK